MRRTGWFVNTLVVVGTLLVIVPVAGTVLAAIPWMTGASRNIDWLMPAELGLAALIGGAALLAAALVSRDRRALALWGNGLMYGGIVLGTLVTRLTGLATGEREAVGWPVWVTIGCLGVYVVGVIVLIVGGVLLCKDILAQRKSAPLQLA